MSAETSDARLDAAVELMIALASGDLGARGELSEQGDSVDAIVAGLNMLAEELEAEREGRVRAEALLRDELDAYERAPGLFASVDAAELTVVKCNQTLAEALGVPKEEILGRSVLELHAEPSREEVRRALEAAQSDEAVAAAEVMLTTQSGRTLIADLSATRVDDPKPERFRIIWRDVTAEKALGAQLQRAQRMEAVGRLSGGIAHDFNNLLAVVVTSASFLRDTLSQHDLETDDVDAIEEAAARGASLVDDLLAFSRQRVVRPVPCDIREGLLETERMIRRLIGDDVQLTVDVEDAPLVAVIDPSQLSQVLINLAINARDAMPSGGSITLEAARRTIGSELAKQRVDLEAGDYVMVAVSDTGVGMSSAVVTQAFEPFFTTKPFGTASGLGLSMCYGIVRQAGGRIAIYSEPGQGTTVRVYLPLVTADVKRAESKPASRPPGGRETLLLVEDDRAVRMVTARILERAGYEVLSAENGEDALELAGPDVELAALLTDVTMPLMGGKELAEELKRQRPGLRVLYLSGYTANSIVKHGVLKPDIDFLAKPFSPADLLNAVRTILDRDE